MKLKVYITHLFIIFYSFSPGEINSKTIKTYTITRSFGVETRELTKSIIVKYDSKNKIKDSTLFIHNIPLSEKYNYINFNDRRSLKKLKGVERLMHFKYEYNLEGQIVSKNLYGNNDDSLKWREFYKYLSNGKLWKVIRFDPSKVHSDNKINGLDPSDQGNMPWGETYSYNDSGEIMEHKEFYAGYIIESTVYNTDSNGTLMVEKENFDPSLMIKTTFSYNDKGQIEEKIDSRRGFSFGSNSFEYDKFGRKVKIKQFNQDGNLETTSTFLYNDNDSRQTKIITDQSKKLIRRIETKLNSKNKKIIEATFDGKSRLIQKKTIGYNKNGRISRIHDYDMLKPGENGKPILISIITYEYD
tara:strand:+ start:4142 stop:5212 length:1071 start_codon:yes stop_codon:yes gene_type:complete